MCHFRIKSLTSCKKVPGIKDLDIDYVNEYCQSQIFFNDFTTRGTFLTFYHFYYLTHLIPGVIGFALFACGKFHHYSTLKVFGLKNLERFIKSLSLKINLMTNQVIAIFATFIFTLNLVC